MTSYVALLRAVNVGGTGKLPMADLRDMCAALGFEGVRTYIASGNALFASDLPEQGVKEALEQRLQAYAGKPVGVMVRTAEEMQAVLDANPFPDAAPNRTLVTFLDVTPAADALTQVRNLTIERLALGGREVYIDYATGLGTSKLVLPAAAGGTARNMNTVAKLAQLARDLP